jgi:HK97 family phage prohead protease
MSEKEVIKREAVGTIEGTGDGRTLDLRVVPWNTKARVTDNGRDFYEEVWLPGCFERQEGAPNRVDVLMNFEHERGIGGVIGRGTELRNEADGQHGTFRMLQAADADKALELVNEGILTGVSLEAEPIESVNEDGVIKRVKARLVNIALCRSPAFQDAQVLAVREKSDEEPDVAEPRTNEELVAQVLGHQEAKPEPSDVDAVLARIGYVPLVSRAVTKKPWNGSAARFEDDEYKRSCLIDRGGDAPVKERCSLPVLEPNGDINVNALAAAAGRLNQVKAPAELKKKAARKLIRYYNVAGMPPPEGVRQLASR